MYKMFTLQTSFKPLLRKGVEDLKPLVLNRWLWIATRKTEDFCPNYVQEFGLWSKVCIVKCIFKLCIACIEKWLLFYVLFITPKLSLYYVFLLTSVCQYVYTVQLLYKSKIYIFCSIFVLAVVCPAEFSKGIIIQPEKRGFKSGSNRQALPLKSQHHRQWCLGTLRATLVF